MAKTTEYRTHGRRLTPCNPHELLRVSPSDNTAYRSVCGGRPPFLKKPTARTFQQRVLMHLCSPGWIRSVRKSLPCGIEVGFARRSKRWRKILRDVGYDTTCVGFSNNPGSRGFDTYLDFSGWGPDESGRSPKAKISIKRRSQN